MTKSMKRSFATLLIVMLVYALTLAPQLVQAAESNYMDYLTMPDESETNYMTFVGDPAYDEYDYSLGVFNSVVMDHTFTITNRTEAKIKVTFTYKIEESGEGTCSWSFANATDVNGLVTATLGAGESFSVTLAINPNAGDKSCYFDMYSITVEEVKAAQVTVSYDTTLGTVNYEDDALVEVPEAGLALTATTKNGSKFLGWVDQDDKILSTDASFTLTATNSLTEVKACFASTSPWFQVPDTGASYLIEGLNEAAAKAAKTANKTMVLMNDATLASGKYEVPAGVNMIVPFDDAHTPCIGKPNIIKTARVNPSAYRTLTMSSGAELTVKGGLSVAGSQTGNMSASKTSLGTTTSTGNGAPSGPLGMIQMSGNSSIVVASGGNLYAWGYIYRTGVGNEGTVTVQKGGTVYEDFQVTDFRGGTFTTEMVTGNVMGGGGISGFLMNLILAAAQVPTDVFPFSQYYVQNIQVPLTIMAGASEKVVFSAQIGDLDEPVSPMVEFVGVSGGMFRITDDGKGGAITKDYIEGQDRLYISVTGNITMGNIILDLTAGGTSLTVDSSKFVLPLNGNISVDMKDGCNITFSQDICILPEAELYIREGATVTLASGVEMYVYDGSDWNDTFCGANQVRLAQVCFAWPKVESTRDLKDDAQLTIGGTLNATAGKLYTTTNHPGVKGEGDVGKLVITGASDTNTRQASIKNHYGVLNLPEKNNIKAKSPLLVNGADTDTTNTKGVKNTTYEYKDGKWCAHTNKNPIAAVAATCQGTGLTAGENCKDCGKILKAQETTEQLDHSYTGEYQIVDGGHKQKCVNGCNEYGDVVAHDYTANVTAPTCTADGYTTHTCACGDKYTDTVVTAPGHTPAAAVKENENPATCVAGGSYEEVVYCSVENCKAEISRVTKTTEATGVHDYSGDWVYTETGHAKKCVNGCDQPGTYADHTFDSACDTDCNDGCGYTRKPSHTFNQQDVKDEYKASNATCTAKATYYYSCACGAKGTTTFETGESLGHEDKDFNHICDRNCGKKDMGVHDDGDDNNHFCDYGCGQVADDGCHDVATDGDHKCDECEAANVTICVDSGKDHVCDTDSACAAYNSGSNAHADADKNHACDYGCAEEIGKDQHMDSADDDDHFCDYGCKQVLEACSDADNDGDHKCDICEKESVTACADSGKDHACDTDSACTAYSTGENEHKAAANSHDCAYCGEAATECKDSLDAQNGKAATCTEDGFNAYWTCSVCSANYADDQAATKIENLEAWKSGDGKINKINHNMVVSQVVAPTCISDGYTVYACSYGCETTENREKVEALGHSWVDADCDTPKTCSVCNATEGDALGHTPGAEADCVNAQTCTVCGTVLNAAQGHTWTDATCTAAKTCSVCGATEGEALAHNYENNNGFCKVCGNYEPAALNGDVYEISNAGQLYWFAQKVNGGDTKIKGALTANIDLNPGYAFHTDGTVTYNGETVTEGWRSWTPIGTGKAYAGIFDGRNYTVMGARATGVRSAGLFGSLDTAQIKNLSVDNSYFVGDHHAGGIVGGADYGHILNCHNNATVISGANTTGSSGAGGIIGFNGAAESGTGSIIGCSNTGYVTSLSGLAYVGGILGHGQELTISNCYNHGAVVGGQVRAGIAANLDYGGDYVSNCYNTSDVSNPYSGIAGGIYKTSFSNCYYLADSETDNFAGTTAMTAEQFASGEVAYLLNGGDAQSQKVWFQTCGEGYPAFSGETVYKHRSGGCTAGSYVYGYSNEDLADITTHNVTKVDAVAATCTEEGNVLHYHCADCEKNYSDEEATDELSVVVTNKLNHTYETYVNNGETHSLTCNACGVVDPNCNGADHYFDVNDDHKCACGKIGSITVIWLNEDGSELKKIEVTFGTKYEDRAPEAPTKAATAEYTYTFSSWKYVEDEDTGNVTATPLFNYMANSYTVKWMDGDTVVKEETLDYGAEITKHAELTKEGYTFNGWEGFSKDMTMPAKDVTFTAKWLVNSYTITWMNGEEVFATTEVNFGEQITAPEGTPKKAKSEACEVFTFSGWCVIPETMPADENLVIYAQYDSKVIHQWQEQIVYSWEGSVCTATHVCLNNQAHNETARPDETKQVVDKVATCTETGTYHYEAIFNDGWAKGTSVGETSYTLAKDPNAHTIVYVAKVSATCVEAGVKEHWKCSACNALFEDEAGTTATTAEALVIAKSEEHTWKDACDSDCEIEGCTATREAPHDLEGVEWQNTETEHWKVCKLCSAEVNKVAHTVQNGKCTACDKVFGVAQIGDQVYATLKEALDAAKALENPTITLLADVEGKVTIAQVVTIDKNGFAAEIVAGDTYTLVDAEDDAVVKVVKVSNVTIKYKGANTLFEDILYGIAVYDIKGAENIDLMTDAGIMYWYEDEYTPVNLATLEFDPDHAATGLQPYPGTAFYYGQTDGIFTKNLHKDIYIIAYVKLENGDYVFANKVIKYSVVEYAATMYERTESETFKNLYAQLLNYISGAQGYFEKGTPASELANYVLPEELREYTYDSTSLTLAPYVPSDKQVTRNKSVFKGRGKNLLFEEQISMVTLYAIPESYTNTAKEMGVIFWTKDQFDKLSGKPGIDNYGDGVRITQMMYSETDQAWFASAPPVVAKMMHATQYYILGYLVDENGAIHYSGVEGYSVEAYIEQAVRTGSNEMAAFAKRLYAYERAAEAAIS